MNPAMLPVILSVIVVSLSGVMAPGPMFAVTIAKSYRSPWAGARIAIGHAIIEMPIILLIYFGLDRFASFFSNDGVRVALGLLGGGMLIWMGIDMFRARKNALEGGQDSRFGAITAGIVMSGMNPFFLLWWATAGLMLAQTFRGFGAAWLPVFILTHWLCDLVWLSVVSFVVYRTRSLWGQAVQKWMLAGCSVLLLGFGVWFIVSGVQMVV